MIVRIWVRDDETGLLDDEFKDGDVDSTIPDSAEPTIGGQEKKSWLIIKIPDPPNLGKVETDIIKSEFAPAETPGVNNVTRRKRIYRLDWRSKFTAEEIALIEDGNQQLPDGPDVVDGVVINKFTIKDFVRK
jgi:hypothetical protein